MSEEKMAGQNFCEVAAACKMGLLEWEQCGHEGRAIFAQAEAMLMERLKPRAAGVVVRNGSLMIAIPRINFLRREEDGVWFVHTGGSGLCISDADARNVWEALGGEWPVEG